MLAVAGWVAGTRTEVISDIRELVPSDLPELQNVDELQDATGVSGEVEVAVRADDLTDPAVVAWMSDFKQRVLAAPASAARTRPARSRTRSCARSSHLSDLFGDAAAARRSDQVQGDPRPAAAVLLAAFVEPRRRTIDRPAPP